MSNSVHAALPSKPADLEDDELTTVLLEAAALSRGLTTVRLRPNTFLAEDPEGGLVGFQGSRSTGSSHAGIHFCSRRIHRSNGLRAAGVPLPQMAIVDADSRPEAENFAAEMPNGVLLKSTERSRNSSTHAVGPIAPPLSQQWDRLTRRLRLGARMLIEEYVPGVEYAFDVVAGKVVAARQIGRGEQQPVGADRVRTAVRGDQQVAASFHPEVLDLVRRAAGVVPPLASLTVRMACPAPAETAEGCVVLSLAPETDLRFEGEDPSWGAFLAEELVRAEVRQLAVPREPSAQPVRLDTSVTEVSNPTALVAALEDALLELQIRGELGHSGFREVGGTLEGRPGDLALLASQLSRARFAAETPEMVRLAPNPQVARTTPITGCAT